MDGKIKENLVEQTFAEHRWLTFAVLYNALRIFSLQGCLGSPTIIYPRDNAALSLVWKKAKPFDKWHDVLKTIKATYKSEENGEKSWNTEFNPERFYTFATTFTGYFTIEYPLNVTFVF